MLTCVHYKGDAYEYGRYIGSKHAHLKKMMTLFKRNYTFSQNIIEIKSVLQKYCPQLLEEIVGIQEGLEISEVDVFQLFAGYDMPKLQTFGCTSVATKDFYVRNYDFSPEIYDGSFLVYENLEGDQVCGNSQMLVGRLDGMNHHGLVVGLHYVHQEPYRKGFLCSTIVRIVLEICCNVEEAIDLLKELPHASSYNYSLMDKEGNIAVFESSTDHYQVDRGADKVVCVNMFQTKAMKQYNPHHVVRSTNRLNELGKIFIEDWSVEDAHEWFNSRQSPVFFTDYKDYFGTLYTVSYVPQTKQIQLTPFDGEMKQIYL
ncbi:C45 family peptidase [Virgibacillus soli]|uniref:C45 family peptidase n=1 Tax=Paracerasibacillus soli TaxID=480284 RepID=A0ABU5CNT3_9BACI|nr:C45 family peptidase [Virgibacillus soli]MDY0408013.1 C45 family peptidase [Virgibacillus soli]